MLAQRLEDSAGGVVVRVDDVKPHVMLLVLQYMYYGQLELGATTLECVEEIYLAAVAYEVAGLAKLCELFRRKLAFNANMLRESFQKKKT